MKSIVTLIAALFLAQNTFSQATSYINDRDQTHLCGPLEIKDLQTPDFQWFQENYESFVLDELKAKWKKSLKATQVDIYLGTWCGDSKKWVPKFVKLWDELGLERERLNLIALYDGSEKYKQGPNGEEQGADIHRVPTFVFKKNEKEYARIVESPNTDMVTDMAQIALGYPPAPNYKAATYIMNMLSENTKEEVYENFKRHVNSAYRLVGKSSELNTLGYVYLRSGRLDEALVAFHFNTFYFKKDPNVYDSYAEALALAGEVEEAISFYEKVLELDTDNENALKQIEELKQG